MFPFNSSRSHGWRIGYHLLIYAVLLVFVASSTAPIAFGQLGAAVAPPPYLDQWGRLGSGNGLLRTPAGVAVASNGTVYVADTYNHRIQQFTSSGAYVTQWGSEGSGNGQFSLPRGVAVASNGTVYVADTGNHRIQQFTSSGAYVTQWGSQGSGDGQFISPSGVAVASNGTVYVADANNHRIQQFDSSGAYVTQWGSLGNGDGQFNNPAGVAVASNGNVYAADTVNNRIQQFDSSGAYLAQWGSNGSGDGQFISPQGVAVDSNGNVYVADVNSHRIQQFNSSGAYLTKWGSGGSGNGQFRYPRGVAVDSNGTVYVADSNNHRIQRFGTATSTPEIDVQGNGVSIATGDTTPSTADHTDFGSVAVGNAVTHTFTIGNSGSADLTGVAVSVNGANAFTVVSQPAATVGAGLTTGFALRFAPTVSGTLTATVSIANDDSDENPYTFIVGGTGNILAETLVVLDSNGQLTLTDSNGGASNDTLTLTRNDPYLRISDPVNTVGGSGAGVVQVNANTVDVPLANISRGLIIDTQNGVDTVNLNATLDLGIGDLLVTAQTINVNAPVSVSASAVISMTARQTLAVNGGANLTTVNGDLTFRANEGITPTAGGYIGLMVNAHLTTTGAGNLFLHGRGGTSGDAGIGIELLANGRLETAAGNITLYGQGGAGGYSHGINGTGQIASNGGNILLTGTGGDSGNSSRGIRLAAMSITNTVGAISLNGTGGASGTDNIGVYIESTNSRVQTVAGPITIHGQGGASGSSNYGISVYQGQVTSNGGDLSLTGLAGNGASTNIGIRIENGATVSTTLGGTLALQGTGGAGTEGYNYGIDVVGSRVESAIGNIILNGQGGDGGSSNYGIRLYQGQVTSNGGDLSLTGLAGNGTNTNIGIRLDNGATVSTALSGALALQGTGGAGTEGYNFGIEVLGSQVTVANGSLTLTGIGGTGTSHGTGIHIEYGRITSAGSGPTVGAVTLHGTGSASATTDNYGIKIYGGRIDTVAGDLYLTGIGGANASANGWGIFVEGDAQINSTGTGQNAASITITGTAASGVAAYGISSGWAGSTISTVDGALTLHGTSTSTGSGSQGLRLSPSVVRSTGNGDITLNGAAISAADLYLDGSCQVNSGAANLSINANSIDMFDGSISGSGNLRIQPRTPATSIGLGGGNGTLNLEDGELARITDGFAAITIGDAINGTGDVTIDSATFNDPVTIAGGVIYDAAGTDIAGGANAVVFDGNVAPGLSPGVLNVTGDFAFAANDIFAVEIGGATPGEGSSNHDQLNAIGTVTIGAPVTLTLTAVNGYTPRPGATYHIIANDGSDAVSGRFSNLPEGATFTNFLGSGLDAAISYQGGDGNDVVITVNMADIDVQGNGASITNGDTTPSTADHTDFGRVAANGGSVVRTFTIGNSGTGALTLSGAPVVKVTGDSAFSVSTQPGSSSIAAGGSTTFQITFAPSAVGVVTATVSIANDDSDENPYTFIVQGAAVAQLNNTNQVSQQSFSALYNPGVQPCGTELLPTHTLTPTLVNNAADSYHGLYFVVTELRYTTVPTYTPTLCNADGGQGGAVAAQLTLADATLGDGLLAAGESFVQPFQVGLPVRARYRLFVNLYGVPDPVTAANATAGELVGTLGWEVDEDGTLVDSNVQLFLPLVAR